MASRTSTTRPAVDAAAHGAGGAGKGRVTAGRRAAVVYSLAEAAALLEVDVPLLERALELRKCGMFAGAFRDGADGPWMIPERDVRALLTSRPLERMLSLQTVAELLDAGYHHVFRRFKALGLVVEIPELGIQRVPESAVWRLCGRSGGGSGKAAGGRSNT